MERFLPSAFAFAVGDTGLEQPSKTPAKTTFSEEHNAQSDALGAQEAGLAVVVIAWPSLPLTDRKAVLAIVREASAKWAGKPAQ